MPFSYAQYAGNGSATTFSVPFPYLLKAHVKLFYGFNLVDGTFTSELVDGVGFTWTSGTQVQTTVAPAVGQTLTVVRQTPSNALVVQWQDGSNLIAGDLIDSSLQTLYAVQEQEDAVLLASAQSAAAATAATAAVTTANAASATANGIAGTANTALSSANAAVATANAASSAAATATATANGIAGTANTALASANAAVTTANAADATANSIAGTASSALATANAAVTTANTANATANGIAGTANTALSNANAAVATANTANATASSVATTANTALSNSSAAVATANAASSAAAAADAIAVAALPKAGGTMTGNVNLLSANGGQLAGCRNQIINGNFDVWQRGTSFTLSEYGADRWVHTRNGTTHTVTRQTFTPGQTAVPGNPFFYCRTVVSSVTGVNNYSSLLQRIEGVRTFAGQQVTFSFWAKADATKNIAVEFQQNFGSGGSPSTAVEAIAVTKVSIGSSWQKVTVTTTLPSISGKTVGANNDDYLLLAIFFDAGSTYNARTNSLGHQSGTFEIAQAQLESGPVATPFEQRPLAQEVQLCYRYFRLLTFYGGAYTGANACFFSPEGINDLRAAPAITSTVNGFQFYNGTTWTSVGTSTGAALSIYLSPAGTRAIQVNGLTGNGITIPTTTSAAALGTLSAEL